MNNASNTKNFFIRTMTLRTSLIIIYADKISVKKWGNFLLEPFA
jgi:hypothetical protein